MQLPRGPRERRKAAGGFTLLEIIVVLAVLAVGFSLSSVAFRAPTAQVYASALRNLVLQARFEAIRRNQPVVVGFDAGAQEFVVRLAGEGASDWCADLGDELRRSTAAQTARLTIMTTVIGSGSLVWIPSGQARNCSRGPFTEDFADIADGRADRRVVIGAAGKVEVE